MITIKIGIIMTRTKVVSRNTTFLRLDWCVLLLLCHYLVYLVCMCVSVVYSSNNNNNNKDNNDLN